MPGGHSAEVIPVPIPNTEVKLCRADDTAVTRGKVGSCQAFFYATIFFTPDAQGASWGAAPMRATEPGAAGLRPKNHSL